MKTKLLAILLLAGTTLMAGPRFSIGVGVGVPAYGYGYGYGYRYAPRPVVPYVAPYVAPVPAYGYGYVGGYYPGIAPYAYGYRVPLGYGRVAPRYYGGRYYGGYRGRR